MTLSDEPCPTHQRNKFFVGAATSQQASASCLGQFDLSDWQFHHAYCNFSVRKEQAYLLLLQISLATLMSQLANLSNLRHLELEQNTGITGPLADATPDTSSGLCTVVQVRWHRKPVSGSAVVLQIDI